MLRKKRDIEDHIKFAKEQIEYYKGVVKNGASAKSQH